MLPMTKTIITKTPTNMNKSFLNKSLSSTGGESPNTCSSQELAVFQTSPSPLNDQKQSPRKRKPEEGQSPIANKLPSRMLFNPISLEPKSLMNESFKPIEDYAESSSGSDDELTRPSTPFPGLFDATVLFSQAFNPQAPTPRTNQAQLDSPEAPLRRRTPRALFTSEKGNSSPSILGIENAPPYTPTNKNNSASKPTIEKLPTFQEIQVGVRGEKISTENNEFFDVYIFEKYNDPRKWILKVFKEKEDLKALKDGINQNNIKENIMLRHKALYNLCLLAEIPVAETYFYVNAVLQQKCENKPNDNKNKTTQMLDLWQHISQLWRNGIFVLFDPKEDNIMFNSEQNKYAIIDFGGDRSTDDISSGESLGANVITLLNNCSLFDNSQRISLIEKMIEDLENKEIQDKESVTKNYFKTHIVELYPHEKNDLLNTEGFKEKLLYFFKEYHDKISEKKSQENTVVNTNSANLPDDLFTDDLFTDDLQSVDSDTTMDSEEIELNL